MAVNIGPRISIDGDAEFNKSIKGIIEQTKTLKSEMTKLESTFDKDTTAKEKNAKKTELLTQLQENLEKRVEECKRAVKASEDQFGKNSAQTEKWRQALNTAETELNNVNAELENLTPLKTWQAEMETVSTKLTAIGDKMQSVGKDLSTYVTLPLVALGTKGVTAFAEVDKTMTLAVATMGATEEEADALGDAMAEAAANSTFGMSDAAEASLNFARAGLDAEQAAAALAPAMNLAAGEGGTLDTVSAGLVATINGFGGSFNEATTYADVFANACNNSALDVDSLSGAMSIAAPIFSAAGYSVNDAALYMGVMANAGIDANTAATSLKTGFARLVKPTDEAQTALDDLGISVVNADGSMKDSVTIQEELHNAFAGLSESEQIAAASAIFGKNQMSNWLALINTAPEDVQGLSNALSEEGTTAQMAETMMSGFGGSMEKLKSSMDVAVTSLGESLAPTISVVADKIQKLVDWFNGLDDEQRQTIATIGMIVAAIGPALVVVGKVISTVGTITGAIGKLGPAIMGLNPTLLLVVGGIAAAVAAGVLLYENWDTIKEKCGQLKDNISTKFDEIKTKMSDTWETVKEKGTQAMDELSSFTSSTLSKMQSTFEQNGGGIKGAQAALMTGLQTIYTAGFNKIDSITGGKLTAIKNLFTTTFNNAKSIVSDALTRIKGLFNFSWSFPKLKMPHFSWSWQSIGGLVSIPKISVSWYAKAMDDGMILNRPTIFGASGGSLLGAGEAGSETVVGTGSLISMIRQAVREGMGYVPDAAGSTTNYGGVTVNVFGAPGQDVEELADLIEERMTANVLRREGAWA